MRILTILALLFLAFPCPTKTEPLGQSKTSVPDINTVSGFREMCGFLDIPDGQKTEKDVFGQTYCTGWINGFVNGFLLGEISDSQPLKICLPEGNSFGQMLR